MQQEILGKPSLGLKWKVIFTAQADTDGIESGSLFQQVEHLPDGIRYISRIVEQLQDLPVYFPVSFHELVVGAAFHLQIRLIVHYASLPW
ncbi:MAG: hypothetical protein WBN83_17320 [Desulfoprunum sp.]|uniref:hypothetical protein n=1 Tax=Desulfoprunum sp. TaxID=2020866 RepID=UPI0026819314